MKSILMIICLTLLSCSTTSPNKTRSVANVPPTFDTDLITPYNNQASSKPVYPIIAHHQKEEFELFYLGVRHDNDLKSATNKLVDQLFKDYQFDAVIIEPFSYSAGESPAWFLQESREGMTETTIPGGEMALASIRANEKGIPFFGGEIDQKETYLALKAKNYTNEDIVGYHLARVIPQWNRDSELKKSFDQKASKYILSKCKSFEIEQSSCPSLSKLKIWYKNKTTKELGPDVIVADVAPNFQSPLFLHKLSLDNDMIRNQFTLNVIGELLRKYKRVAVVYGGAHYTSLKKSIETSMGTAMVVGNSFTVPATQQISFVPLKKSVSSKFIKDHDPKVLDLRDIQSSVKSQGQRGACTYFTISSLVESIIKKATKKEIDISEEYIAWSGKVKKGMRANEEDSSVAVNAVALQEFGFMLESDLPYQQSWFDEGAACEGQRDATNVDPICYSHSGPDQEKLKRIIEGKNFVFESVNSSSLDVIKALSARGIPVTVSIFAHPDTWSNSVKSGEIAMTKKMKDECMKKTVRCSGHAALIVGYNLVDKKFLIKNSWGEDWGDKGYGSISFDYLDQMSPRLFLTGHLKGSLELP